MQFTVIDMDDNRTTYHPFTTQMWRSCTGKIAAIKLWRELHKVIPVEHDKNGHSIVPSLSTCKRIVEAAKDAVESGIHDAGFTCRVQHDYRRRANWVLHEETRLDS
jgi:hypothetical protein